MSIQEGEWIKKFGKSAIFEKILVAFLVVEDTHYTRDVLIRVRVQVNESRRERHRR
jgi:hypothetical protein